MKNVIHFLITALLIVSCNEENKDYVTLSGKITNPISDSLVVIKDDIIKSIKVNEDGTFLDTLRVETRNYKLFDGQEQASIYLKNGYNLRVTLDANVFDETIKFEGVGAEANNYLAKKMLLQERLLDFDALMITNKLNFEEKLNTSIEQFKALLNSTPNLEISFIEGEKKDFKLKKKQLTIAYNKKNKPSVFNGHPSPKFNNYENFTGSTTSLDDLKGKYVYIDLWATWCGPCKAEIPSLKRIEKAYHDKNIVFVSISLDNPKGYKTWKTMVKEKALTGIQLYANADYEFTRAFNVSTIPRFILIDPNGIVINDNAPRPSNKSLVKLFDGLDI